VFHYDPQVVTGLKHSTWARIRWFYYCDQQGGNTIRLYDREFFDNSERLYEETQSCVILRGENLGKPSGEVKIAIRRELRDLKTPPLGINTRPENKEKCFQFFGRLNTLPEGADDE
jgi:hypothetical protein